MIADRTTDAIAHFIGLFGQKMEELRNREAYDTFAALRDEPDLGPIDVLDLEIEQKFSLKDSDNTINHSVPPTAPKEVGALTPAPAAPANPGLTATGFGVPTSTQPDGPLLMSAHHGAQSVGIVARVEGPQTGDLPYATPGSILTISQQTLKLSDNDQLGQGVFRDPEDHAEALEALAEQALELQVSADLAPGEIPDGATVEALREALDAFTESDDPAVDSTVLRAEAGPVSVVNGDDTPEELPGWSEMLPAHHRPEEEEEAASEAPTARDLPSEYTPNRDFDEGHSLITGGNLLANEAFLAVSLVDAPVIAVGGSWQSLDVVSQVAVLSDRDTGEITEAAPSEVYQSVTVTQTANPASWHAGRDATGAGPQSIRIDYVKADLFISNHVEQTIEMLDNDLFAMSFTGASSAFILGDNTMINATTLITAGLAYDLILIGGNYLQVDIIKQTLVLSDDDHVTKATEVGGTESALPPAPLPAPASADGPAALPGAIVETGEARDGTATSGPDIAIDPAPPDSIDGMGEPLPAAAVAPITPPELEAESGPESSEPAGPGHETATGPESPEPAEPAAPDNLLVNEARLSTSGVDTHAELTASLSELVHDPDLDLQTLQQKLLNDPALAGLEQARVLKIDGDLIQATTIEQTIIAADNDDIHLGPTAPPDLEVVAGSNALLNAATVATMGIDSTVMAEAGYSELLIHQAGLIDEAETPLDPATQELATEAVAFLMDDAGDGALPTDAPLANASAAPLGADSLDLMAATVV
ncbi:hypothetical protein KUV62_21465 [Salipiger bermudensis]|uniref:hypothetical protein n=1 Tax=Salipiger bermudensis TaxID=344736 RepID=UPI001C9A258A|nr:hypothetical protein [Salipiger bermudensis]MBY6006508.1 hypothetical protein [Salipiger bermudensis]